MKAKRRAKLAAEIEHKATRKAASLRDNPVVAAAGKASEVADQPPLIALSLGTLVVGALLRRPAVVRGGARMLASHLIATGMKTVLKNAVDRTRPGRAISDKKHKIRKGEGASDTELNSFPSGHTAGAVAVAQAVARDWPGAALPARLGAASVGAMQLPRGAHYLSDVAVGAAIGWVSERIGSILTKAGEGALKRLSASRVEHLAEAEAEAHPS